MSKHSIRHKIPTTYIEGIAIREQRPQCFVVDFMINGIRTRKCFKSVEDATLYARQKRVEIKNQGTSALSITDKMRVEVEEVLKKLEGRVSISEAVDYWLKKHPAGIVENWDQTATRYILAMREGGRREISIAEKQYKFDILSEALNNPATLTLEKIDIENAIERLSQDRDWTSQTAIKYIGAGLTLLRFARGTARRMVKSDEEAPTTWDAQFIATMMQKAEEITPAIVSGLAVMTFAGLRPQEAMRLNWGAVNLEKGLLELSGETTKTRTSRHVKITPNLKQWLLTYSGNGKIIESASKYRREREKLMQAIGITEWPNDVLRHTAATMIYARTKSVDETCYELGHFGTSMFLKHYKGAAPKPDDVTRFWSITPKGGEHEQ